MKISWCYDPCQRSSERGWRILIPQQGKFMFLLSSTYKSEGVANFDPFMKISWGYGLDPLDHSPIPYQAPERWWWWWCCWWWWWWSWGVEQRRGWREHVKTTINHPFGNGLYHLFTVILGMVYYCFNHIASICQNMSVRKCQNTCQNRWQKLVRNRCCKRCRYVLSRCLWHGGDHTKWSSCKKCGLHPTQPQETHSI